MSSEIEFKVVDRSSVRSRVNREFSSMVNTLINLPKSKAIEIPVPKGKKPATFRLTVMKAASKQGLRISTYFGEGNKILYIWRVGEETRESQRAESESGKLD